MEGCEIVLSLYHERNDYNHKLYSYYESKEDSKKMLVNPINKAHKNKCNKHCQMIIPIGIIEILGYFMKDYNSCNEFDIKIMQEDIVIKKAIIHINTEEIKKIDESKMEINNIVIEFDSSNVIKE